MSAARDAGTSAGLLDRLLLTPERVEGMVAGLEKLAELNERHHKAIELRFFGGLSVEETAHVLGVSPQTVHADWRMARAWLRRRIRGS